MEGPDDALVDYRGDHPAERFNPVHMFHDDPFCAQLWYQTHLSAPAVAGRATPAGMTESTCRVPRGPERSWPALEPQGMFRAPVAAVGFRRRGVPPLHRPGGKAPPRAPGPPSPHTAPRRS